MPKERKCKYVGCEGCTYPECPATKNCRVWKAQARKEYRAAHPEQKSAEAKRYNARYPEYNKTNSAKWRAENPEYTTTPEYKVGASLSGHARKGYSIEITVEEAAQIYKNTTHCRYCGNEMVRDAEEYNPLSPSLDRINNETTLTRDNVQYICRGCNATKGAHTHKEFLAYLRGVQ